MTFNIHTELKPNIVDLVNRFFQAYSLRYGMGVWKGTVEASVTIVLIYITEEPFMRGTDNDKESLKEFRTKVYELAKVIKEENKQEAVLIEEVESNSTLV